jgi:diguanylate cyclase (GGDEF)-like protein
MRCVHGSWLVCLLLLPLSTLAIDCGEAPGLAQEIAALRDTDPVTGLERVDEALADLRQGDVDCPVGEALLLRARVSNLVVLGRQAEGLQSMDKALALIDQADQIDPEHRAVIHLTAGVLYWNTEAHDDAITHYMVALEASREAGDEAGAARAAGNLGNLYNTIGDLARARSYHEQALEGFERAGTVLGQAGSRVNLAALAGRIARHARGAGDEVGAEEAFSEMLEHGRIAMALFEILENPRGRAYAATNIASAYTGLGQPQEALVYHLEALSIHQEVGDVANAFETQISMFDAYRQMAEYAQARDVLDEAAELMSEGNLAQAMEVTQRRVELAEDQRDFEEALRYQKEITTLRRLIADNQMVARVEEVRLALESEQRQRQLELLMSEAEISELRLHRQQVTIVAVILMVILLLGSLILLYSRYRSRVRSSHQFERAARTDPLTGLANRREMLERLAAAHADCHRSQSVHALILIDIDDFKDINDTHGHAAGDQVLRQVADIFQSAIRGRDVVARWGGEEFLLLLPLTDLAGAQTVAENIRSELSASTTDSAVENPDPTLTMGVTELTTHKSIDQALAEADAALYRGKRAGKNRVELHESPF